MYPGSPQEAGSTAHTMTYTPWPLSREHLAITGWLKTLVEALHHFPRPRESQGPAQIQI